MIISPEEFTTFGIFLELIIENSERKEVEHATNCLTHVCYGRSMPHGHLGMPHGVGRPQAMVSKREWQRTM